MKMISRKNLRPSPLMNSTGTGEQMKWRREKEIDALMMMINTNCDDNQRHVSRFHAWRFR